MLGFIGGGVKPGKLSCFLRSGTLCRIQDEESFDEIPSYEKGFERCVKHD